MSGEKRLLILGTGSIARHHAERFGLMPGCQLVAAVDSNDERARDFATAFQIPVAFGSLQEAIAWGEFDAAVNSTPDGIHKATTLELIAAGKPVFCEKPLAVNYPDAQEMVTAAEKANLVNMVNLTYRNAAAIQLARTMVAAGDIGEVRHVQASYLQSWLTGRHWGDWRTDERWLWRLSSAHGSKGVLGDIGVHILDFVTFGTGLEIIALNARMRTFDKADGGMIDVYKLDVNDSVAITAEFSNGALGVIHMSRYATGKANDLDLMIHGEKGALKVWANSTEFLSGSLSRPRHRDPDLEAGRLPANPAQRDALPHRAPFRRERRPRLPPRRQRPEAARPRLRLRRGKPDASGLLTGWHGSRQTRGTRSLPPPARSRSPSLVIGVVRAGRRYA